MRSLLRLRRGNQVNLSVLLLPLLLVVGVAGAIQAATVTTDKPDYPPGETVWITGYGFAASESVTVVVKHVDTTIVGGSGHDPWKVQANGSGSFLTYWIVPYDDNVGETLRVKATGQTSGLVATTTFSDINSILTFVSLDDTIAAGQCIQITANLKQNCGGGPDSALFGREILFFATEQNCGVDIAQVSPCSSFTDSAGNAVCSLCFDSAGDYGIRIKYRGEDKPDPCPDTGNSACDPFDPSDNKRCVAISNSNECQELIVVGACDLNDPPVAGCPPNDTVFLCAFDTICVGPFSCTDPDNNLSSNTVLITPAVPYSAYSGGNLCFLPNSETTYSIQHICLDSCGEADTCVTYITVIVNDSPQFAICPSSIDPLLCQGDSVCVWVHAVDVNDDSICITQLGNCPASFVGGSGPGGSSLCGDSAAFGYFCLIPDTSGTYSCTLVVTDPCGAKDTCAFSITVEVNSPPVAGCPSDTSFNFLCEADTVCRGPFTCFDPDGNLLSSTATITPAVPYSNFDGTNFCFLPNKDTTYCIQHICLDSCGAADTCNTYVTINFTNQPPDIVGPADKDTLLCPPGTVSFVVCGTDPDAGDTITIEKVSGPGTFCTKTGAAPVCCTLSATISADGQYCWVFKVTNGCGVMDFDTVCWTIDINDPPVCSSPPDDTVFLCTQTQICVKPFSCNDPNSNLASHTVSLGTLAGDSVCFTPAPNKDSTYCITSICTDSCNAADTCQTCVTVIYNKPPTAICPDTSLKVCAVGTPICFEVKATDPDAGDTVCLSQVSGAPPVDPFGKCGLSPVSDTFCFMADTAGTYRIIVKAQDECGAMDIDTCTVIVTDINDPPVVDGGPDKDTLLCAAGTVKIPVCATDPDVGDSITLELVSGPGSFCTKKGLSPVCCTLSALIAADGEYCWVFKVTNGCNAMDLDTVCWTIDINDPPVATCPNDTTVEFFCKSDTVCLGPFDCSDPNSNYDTSYTNLGSLVGGQLCFVPADKDSTYEIKFICVDDCGKADTCITHVTVKINRIHVKIDCIEGDPGQTKIVPIWLKTPVEIGGFEFCVEFKNTDLTVVNVERGTAIDDTDATGKFVWHYLTYRLNPSTVIHKYKICVVGIGKLYSSYPGMCLQPDSQYVELLRIRFVLANNELLRCQQTPIVFEWDDFTCLENTFSDCSGYILYVSNDPSQFDPDSCPAVDKNQQIFPCVVFEDGCVKFRCPQDVDPIVIGDINVNGHPYEIADAVLFSNYFINGADGFSLDYDTREAQIGATDINRDGYVLSVADLVYLLRIIIGDQAPLGEGTGLEKNLRPSAAGFEGDILQITSDKTLGAVWFVFRGEGKVTPIIDNGLTMIWNAAQGETKVLIYGLGKNVSIPAGISKLFSIFGQVELTRVEAADYYGRPVEIKIFEAAPTAPLPTKYLMSQNYPNPFNATTQVRFALPEDGRVSLIIYNLAGQMVKTFDEFMTAGYRTITWDGTNGNGQKVASGVYFYRLSVGEFSEVKKMTLLK